MSPLNVVRVKHVVLCLLFSISSVYCQDLIVNTTLGQVRGVPADDGDYTMYLGIPFAKVNEDNPFGEALPPPLFEGIFEANDDSAICPQEEEFNHTIVGSLDCLYLNIHVPSTASPTNLRPVFVWIFGGGFTLGFYGRFLYGPKFLVRHDIVFVTLNYRLGPYGFMCLDIPEVPGNQALKDQLMALRWLQDNIANFGGDPNKITVAGNSAGSMSVDYHLRRKDDGPKLFQQFIIQSGTALMSSLSDGKDIPFQIAHHLGFETNDVYEALAFLANTDPLVVIETVLEHNIQSGICVEKEFPGVEAFITEEPASVTELPVLKDMPIMIGFMKDEMLALGAAGVGDTGPFLVYSLMSTLFDPTHPDFSFMVETTQKFYFGDEEINDNMVSEYIDFIGDLTFIYSTFEALDLYLNNEPGDLYLFQLSYDGGRNFVKHRENLTLPGVAHADELGYLFDISYMEEPNDEDQRVVDAMTTMWANFVKYADPTPELSDLIPYKWEAISPGSPQHYMDIDLQLRTGNRPLRERIAYWDLLFHTFGEARRSSVDQESALYKLLKKVRL